MHCLAKLPIPNDTWPSYMGVVLAKSGLLLGGVKRHVSARFASKSDAYQWALIVKLQNTAAGRDVFAIEVLGSNLSPEIHSIAL